jgi:hypothetical protein
VELHVVERKGVVGERRMEGFRVVRQGVLSRGFRGTSYGGAGTSGGEKGLGIGAVYLGDFELVKVIVLGKEVEVELKRVDRGGSNVCGGVEGGEVETQRGLLVVDVERVH